MKEEKGSGIIAIIVIILFVFFVACVFSSNDKSSSSSGSSKYTTQYQKDIDHIGNVYNMKPSEVDTKIKAVEKALKNK